MLAGILGVYVQPVCAQVGDAGLLSEAGPTFSVPDRELSRHVTVIGYGDMRFHDPENHTVADPVVRKLLVERIAKEKPDALQLSGDVPYKGTDAADYKVYKSETAAWQAEKLRVYPAMGNHELSGGEAQGVENWWAAFPELKGRRWYSAALGSRLYLIQLDSTLPLLEGSKQMLWLQAQIASLPKTVDFVMIALHHPPVADIQTHIEVDHNPRPNEIALRDYLTATAPKVHAQFVVTAGHIHNYERAQMEGVTYLVSGGGGARPYYVERTAQDLYTDPNFPVFHYVKFELEKDELKATMYKLRDATEPEAVWQEKDHFTIGRKQ